MTWTPIQSSARLVGGIALAAACCFGAAARAELLPPGFRPLAPGVHALMNATVVTRPGESSDNTVVLIRNGMIEDVGRNLPAPADARVWDMKGSIIYAGFIEPYLMLGATNPPVSTTETSPVDTRSFASGGYKFFGAPGAQADMGKPGPGYELASITPEYRIAHGYSPRPKTLEPLRELGFTAGLIVPARGVLRGTSALALFSDDDPGRSILRPDVAQHVAFEVQENVFPGSLMGVIAAVRQTFLDAGHYGLEHSASRRSQARTRPQYVPALEALAPALEGKTPVWFEPGSALMVHRAAAIAREFGLQFAIVSSGQEWRRPDLARATGATFVVPVHFPEVPKLPGEADWEQVTLDQLRAWDWAPANAALLRQQGLSVALSTHGLADRKTFRRNLRLAIDGGLTETDALAALTTVPAALCGADRQLGTIEPGKIANLVVVSGNYFDPDTKVRAVWIEGKVYPAPGAPDLAANAQPVAAAAAAGETPGKEEPEKHPAPTPPQSPAPQAATNGQPAGLASTAPEPQSRELRKTTARSPLADRGPLASPRAVLLRNATIWTCGPAGILTNAHMLVVDGRIQEIGRGAGPARKTERAGPDLFVVDVAGRHVTPGIIDAHSHTAILGNANEMTLPSTAMVRISDVLNSETANLYRQLAGGVTTVNLLHGSANPIGGQSCVIKLRDGAAPADLIFTNAPPGIKFALGENVKQSNWGEKFTTRFPQSRMGVRAFIQNRFVAAQQYLRDRREALATGMLPPRPDLELEALGEVIEGRRWIQCHGYRQDEMLMLVRLMNSFGVRVATFDHALEGYKVADELAAAGVGATTFSDWWAIKVELFDAIPWNASLMRDRGVLVSFSSDSSELARRLYLEAAKAVKYGGTPDPEALKFITLNPAKQLRIDRWVGSLEPGKDADFVVWSKAPLDAGTICLETWIEGNKYFDRSLDAERTSRLEEERGALLAKARIAAGKTGSGPKNREAGALFLRESLEHEYDGRNRDSLDNQ